MEFCSTCGNIYYVRLSDTSDSLTYYCRCCGNTDLTRQQVVVTANTALSAKKDKSYHHLINQYTKFDPTNPHITTIPCPSEDCPSIIDPAKFPTDVVHLRYDDKRMLYVNICVHCDVVWSCNR